MADKEEKKEDQIEVEEEAKEEVVDEEEDEESEGEKDRSWSTWSAPITTTNFLKIGIGQEKCISLYIMQKNGHGTGLIFIITF